MSVLLNARESFWPILKGKRKKEMKTGRRHPCVISESENSLLHAVYCANADKRIKGLLLPLDRKRDRRTSPTGRIRRVEGYGSRGCAQPEDQIELFLKRHKSLGKWAIWAGCSIRFARAKPTSILQPIASSYARDDLANFGICVHSCSGRPVFREV